MSETTELKPSEWRELPDSQSRIQWLAQEDRNLVESEAVVCNLGFDQHCIATDFTEINEAFATTKHAYSRMSSLERLMDLNFSSDEFEHRIRASLSGEICHLLSGKRAAKGVTVSSNESPIVPSKRAQEDDILLNSTSTEHAHHSRQKEPNEDWKSGAPSPESVLSYDFPNNSAYSVRQLDCQSDLTEGTNGLSLAPFGSNVGNPSNGPRSRAFSTGDASLNGFASADAWDPNETLSTQERSDTQDEFEEHSLQGLLPGLATEDTSLEHAPPTAVLHLHDIHNPNNINTINNLNPITTDALHHATCRSPVLSTVLECSGTSEFSRGSHLGGRDTFSATAATPISPDTLFGEAITYHEKEQSNCVIDTLVVPTVLSGAAKGLILEVLAEQGAEFKQIHSSAVALVTSYLTTEEAKTSLIRNAGYLRVLVLETSAGISSASVVVVESPLQCDLPELNTSSSTSTDTNLSSNPCHSSSTSSSSPSTSATSTSNASNNVRSDTIVTLDNDSNVSSSTPVDTVRSESSKASTTVSTPAGGMQESTYVLSDSAYIPAKPTATDNTTSNTVLPTFSEDSADYRHNNSTSNNSPTSNHYQDNNNSNNISNGSLSPASPLARSVVVRMECAVWSKYTTESTCNNSDTFNSISKAVPLQDYHYAMANEGCNIYCADQNAAAIGDLQTEMINCIKMILTQQAAMHCPFQPTSTSTADKATPSSLPRRRASYHSLELDQRLYGNCTAAALHELEATANRMDLNSRTGSDDCRDTLREVDVPIPVPVLDAVLLWSSDIATTTTSIPTDVDNGADNAVKVENVVLKAVQTVVQPHLRDPADFLATVGMSNLAASQMTMEGSYIALSPAVLLKQQAHDKAVQKATTSTVSALPLYTLPTKALLHGACVMWALPCDILRIYECNSIHVVQGGSTVLDTPGVGVIVRRTFSNKNSASADSIAASEKVIWLYNPIAAAAMRPSSAAMGRTDRECSLLLTTNNSTTPSDIAIAATSVMINAEPCSVSRRSCPLNPNVSVRAFVQHPPPDTACVVQPSSATYRSDMLPEVCASVALNGSSTGTVGGEQGVLKGNLFFPTIQTSPAALNPPTPQQNTTIFDALAGLYGALCNRLHYLIFPGSTYYIQYYQADVSDSTDSTASGGTGHTAAGVQTVVVNTTAPATHTTPTGWELIIIAQPPLDYGTTNNIHIVNTIPLSTGSIYCQYLITLEEENYEAETAAISALSRREFPPCLVSLSAADNTGIRSLIVKTMTGSETNGSAAGTSSTSADATTTSSGTSRRRKKQPVVQKRHYVELTQSSYQLLRFREQQQRKIRSIRSTLKCVCIGILSVVTVLMLVMLMEVMWVQRQYAVHDVVTPSISSDPVAITTTADATTSTVYPMFSTSNENAAPELAPLRRVPTYTTTTTTSSSYTTTTSQSKDNQLTNSMQRMYYHTCKINPVDPYLPAICTTYVTNEETSELRVVMQEEEDIFKQHGGVKEEAPVTENGEKTSTTTNDENTVEVKDAESLDNAVTSIDDTSGATGPTTSVPDQMVNDVATAPSELEVSAPSAVPETVPIVQHDCGIILPPDLGASAAATSPPSQVPVVVAVGLSEDTIDPVAAVLAHIDSVTQFDYAAKEKLLAELETIALLTKDFTVKPLTPQPVSVESLLSAEVCIYDLEAESTDSFDSSAQMDDTQKVTAATKVDAASGAATALAWLYIPRWRFDGPPQPPYYSRLSAVRDFLLSIPSLCRHYFIQGVHNLQHYYYCTAKYLDQQQQQFSVWSAQAVRSTQRALQHAAHTITTSPFCKALQRHYATVHSAIANTIHTCYPIVYDTLHIDELSAWTQEKVAIVQEDLYSLYEVTHLKALSSWLHTHSALFNKKLRAQRRATLKSQQELLQQGRQVWRTVRDTSTQYARNLQRAVRSGTASLHTAVTSASKSVSAVGTTVYAHAAGVVEVCCLWGAQAWQAMHRAVAGVVTSLGHMWRSFVKK